MQIPPQQSISNLFNPTTTSILSAKYSRTAPSFPLCHQHKVDKSTKRSEFGQQLGEESSFPTNKITELNIKLLAIVTQHLLLPVLTSCQFSAPELVACLLAGLLARPTRDQPIEFEFTAPQHSVKERFHHQGLSCGMDATSAKRFPASQHRVFSAHGHHVRLTDGELPNASNTLRRYNARRSPPFNPEHFATILAAAIALPTHSHAGAMAPL